MKTEEMDFDSFGANIFVATFVTLALWKMVDIGMWVLSHIRISIV